MVRADDRAEGVLRRVGGEQLHDRLITSGLTADRSSRASASRIRITVDRSADEAVRAIAAPKTVVALPATKSRRVIFGM
jgi:hypothetical protein